MTETKETNMSVKSVITRVFAASAGGAAMPGTRRAAQPEQPAPDLKRMMNPYVLLTVNPVAMQNYKGD
jgi:hypothetical protein